MASSLSLTTIVFYRLDSIGVNQAWLIFGGQIALFWLAIAGDRKGGSLSANQRMVDLATCRELPIPSNCTPQEQL
jgi:hypothetical protein